MWFSPFTYYAMFLQSTYIPYFSQQVAWLPERQTDFGATTCGRTGCTVWSAHPLCPPAPWNAWRHCPHAHNLQQQAESCIWCTLVRWTVQVHGERHYRSIAEPKSPSKSPGLCNQLTVQDSFRTSTQPRGAGSSFLSHSRSAIQNISRILWNLKVHCRITSSRGSSVSRI
jgi:hypothetical protein